jgi:hypothetical protein
MDSDFDSEAEYGHEVGEYVSSSEEEESSSEDEKDKDKKKDEPVLHEIPDNYIMDSFLVRREAVLLCLVRKTFTKRVIVFFNEKKQV